MHRWYFILVLALSGCSVSTTETSGPTWEAYCDVLVPGEYKACYGPGWDTAGHKDYSKFDNYQVSVERIHSDRSSTVLYHQQFSASDVDAKLLNMEAQRVVYFNNPKRHVVFELGGPKASFSLP